DKKVVITRSPGRINLMGRHLDHRGGGINVMATDKDTVFVASPRVDDRVFLTNTDPRYPDRVFSIGEELERADHAVWLDYLNDEKVKAALEVTRGDWVNYVKGAMLRAELACGMKLCGMEIASDGCIPVAAGLSSSSSLVVATLEAVKALNALNLPDDDFIRIAGEGEWFVGSRGGAGDHAAMKCGQRDRIIHLGFKPFKVGKAAPFAEKYAVLVANSLIRAKKSEGSKDAFNARVASYECAFMLLKKEYPARKLIEFRDLAAITPYDQIYRMLKTLPEKATREELFALLPAEKDALLRIFATHADPGRYDLRGVALYGISECVRSERFMDLLEENDYASIGDMMKISHDGDRIGEVHITDDYLDACIEKNADPAMVSGAYACSTPEIDGLSDLLNSADGVLGSELVGAGLGGCVIALVEKEKAADVIALLNEKYYDAKGLPHAADVFSASAGSQVIF
ncbi:MAG: hypothetical protein MJ141_05910, partial [Clostridia bacterium]|nr:hypothetical protein [Clostridia bacterium]